MTKNVSKPIPEWVTEFYSTNKNTIEGRTIFKIYNFLVDNGINFSYYLKHKGLYNDATTCLRRMKQGKLPNIISLSKMNDIFTREELCWLVHYWHDEYYDNRDINSGKLIDEFVDTNYLDFEYVDIPGLFYGCTTIDGDSVTQTVTERFIRKKMDRLQYIAKSLEFEVCDA